jgi:hypothetical protein
MNQQNLQVIANQRVAEARATGASQRQGRLATQRTARQSLRVRTGWTLVGVGLMLVAHSASRPAAARPAGS